MISSGGQVLIRSFLDQPIIRRIVEEHDEVVIICREDAYKRWVNGGSKPQGTKVPKTQVFRYEPTLYKRMTQLNRSMESDQSTLLELWEKAKPYYIMRGGKDETD